MTRPPCPRSCPRCDEPIARDILDPATMVDAEHFDHIGWLCPICANIHREQMLHVREAELRRSDALIAILTKMLAEACAKSTCFECPVHLAGQQCGESCEAALMSLALDHLPD